MRLKLQILRVTKYYLVHTCISVVSGFYFARVMQFVNINRISSIKLQCIKKVHAAGCLNSDHTALGHAVRKSYTGCEGTILVISQPSTVLGERQLSGSRIKMI